MLNIHANYFYKVEMLNKLILTETISFRRKIISKEKSSKIIIIWISSIYYLKHLMS